MRPITVLLAAALLLVACTEKRPPYRLATMAMLPDSLRDDVAQAVVTTVAGASNELTTSDYEDPEDVVEAAYAVFQKIYTQEVVTLARYEDNYYQVIHPSALTGQEHHILDSLLWR